MKFLNHVRNVKNNWKTVQASPYASLHFKYKTTLITIIIFSAFIAWKIIEITLNYQGYGWQTWIVRGFTMAIGYVIITKAFQTLIPLRKAMEPYKKNKGLINHTETNAKVEIEDLLSQFDNDGRRIVDTHPGKRELNSNTDRK